MYKVLFESRVFPEGTQTRQNNRAPFQLFESRVFPEGTQTDIMSSLWNAMFESRVFPEGTVTRGANSAGVPPLPPARRCGMMGPKDRE